MLFYVPTSFILSFIYPFFSFGNCTFLRHFLCSSECLEKDGFGAEPNQTEKNKKRLDYSLKWNIASFFLLFFPFSVSSMRSSRAWPSFLIVVFFEVWFFFFLYFSRVLVLVLCTTTTITTKLLSKIACFSAKKLRFASHICIEVLLSLSLSYHAFLFTFRFDLTFIPTSVISNQIRFTRNATWTH